VFLCCILLDYNFYINPTKLLTTKSNSSNKCKEENKNKKKIQTSQKKREEKNSLFFFHVNVFCCFTLTCLSVCVVLPELPDREL